MSLLDISEEDISAFAAMAQVTANTNTTLVYNFNHAKYLNHITYVTGAAKINDMSANYTELHFCYYLPFSIYSNISFLCATEESPLNSTVVIKILLR